jgi:glycosyltransferase involved in cell wall biosynthesis
MTLMTKLSVCIITFNEEKNIARCLDSVKNIADEIVVVDSHSTDKTEAICKAYGVKFILQHFLGYGKQKNFALKQCSNNFVLSLDADEALSPELDIAIRAIKLRKELPDAFSINRLNFFCDKFIRHGHWYPDKKIRLINRQKARWTDAEIHEKMVVDKQAKVEHLKADILHYTYYSMEEFILQGNKFSSLAAQEKFAKNKKASLFNLLVNPFWSFFTGYIIKAGFLDGLYGFIIARTDAYFTFLKYAKLMRLQRQQKNK